MTSTRKRKPLCCSNVCTPVVSDPGFFLITRAIEAGIRAVPVPGPSAVLTALAGSGLPTDSFRFEGFLPRKEGPRSKRIARFREEPATVILFESPHRIAKLLASLLAGLGNRRAVLARELTKHYEEFHRGTLEELIALVRSHPPKGEITLVVEGAARRGRSTPGEEASQEPEREDE